MILDALITTTAKDRSRLMITATVVAAVTAAVYVVYRTSKHRRTNNKYPKRASATFRDFFFHFNNGSVHQLQLRLVREGGPVLLAPIPTFRPSFLVSDPRVVRMVLEGDPSNGIPESDKSFRYKILRSITGGVNTILTKKTHGEHWQFARKGAGPSFSMQHLHRLLPALQTKLNRFNDILAQHATEDKVLEDLAAWGVRLTLDFIATSMFDVDFHCLDARAAAVTGTNTTASASAAALPEGTVSDGQLFLSELELVLKEYTMRQPLNPFRRYQFWNKEVREAARAARSLERLGQKLLDTYRATHTEEQLKADQTVLAYLIRSPYPSDRERVGDITTFLLVRGRTPHATLSHGFIANLLPFLILYFRPDMTPPATSSRGPSLSSPSTHAWWPNCGWS